MNQKHITVGRTVLYVLSESDAQAIRLQRAQNPNLNGRFSTAEAGDVYPAVATRVFDYPGNDNPPVNFKVQLDGDDTFWATSRSRSEVPEAGRWHWPDFQRPEAPAQPTAVPVAEESEH